MSGSAELASRGKILKSIILDVGEISKIPDALRDIYLGNFDALIVKNVFTKEAMATIVSRLTDNDANLQISAQEEREPSPKHHLIYGRSITPNAWENGPPIDDYLEAAARFRSDCRRLFEGVPDFEARVTEIFTQLAGGRDVSVPLHHDGRHYTPATVRYIPTDRQIPIHVGNYFLHLNCYDHLRTVIDLTDQLSYFVVLQTPDKGGELVVYDLLHDDPRMPEVTNERGFVDVNRVERLFNREPLAPQAGDLLIFNGGKFYHRVEFTGGQHPRWTIGGFLAFAKEGPHVYFWG